jgi:2C-methyl-D-erythritol 2,4-cyclodiphosphate synthase
MGNVGKTLQQGLSELKGRDLSSVEFVRDYVQFRFDGPYLTMHVLPSIITAQGDTLTPDKRCYRDFLCERIGVKVRDIEVVAHTEVAVHFEDGTIFKLSLQKEDRRGPEALEFINDGGDIWVT